MTTYYNFIPAPNLVTNGGMEDGNPPTGWTILGDGTFEQSDVEKHNGTYSVHINTDINEGFYQTNDYTQQTGMVYWQSFWYYIVSGQIRSRWQVGSGAGAEEFIHSVTGSWQYWSRYYTEIDGGDDAYTQFTSYAASAEFYIDDISVKRIS
jgi:hypothetical protein